MLSQGFGISGCAASYFLTSLPNQGVPMTELSQDRPRNHLDHLLGEGVEKGFLTYAAVSDALAQMGPSDRTIGWLLKKPPLLPPPCC